MAKKQLKAYSYIRFSTPEQLKGDSLNRQLKLSQRFAEEHNLLLDDSFNLRDLGVSSFKGQNVKDGALSHFIKAVKDGKIEKGSFLLIESFDRLSRQAVITSLSLFLNLLQEGITIATLSDGQIFTPDSTDTQSLLLSIFIMSRAHEESLTKSMRITSAWSNKRDNAENVKLTKMCPTWLVLNDTREDFTVIEERAKVIKTIFELSRDGYGTSLIIQELEKRGIEKWNTRKSKNSTKWSFSYIKKILDNKAVIGEITLKKDGKEARTISDYYPRIISDDLFFQAKDSRTKRRVSFSGPVGKTVTNLFKGLMYCGYSSSNEYEKFCSGDNEKMQYLNKGSKNKYKYLQCELVSNGKNNCKPCRKSLRYEEFERSILLNLHEIDIDTLFGKHDELMERVEQIKSNVLSLESKQDDVKLSIAKISETMLSHKKIPAFMIKRGNELESEIVTLDDAIKSKKRELLIAKNKVKTQVKNDNDLKSSIEKLYSQNDEIQLFELRFKLREMIRKVVKRIDVYANGSPMKSESMALIKEQYDKGIIQKEEYNQMDKLFDERVSSTVKIYLESGEFRLIRGNHQDSTTVIYEENDGLEAILGKNKHLFKL